MNSMFEKLKKKKISFITIQISSELIRATQIIIYPVSCWLLKVKFIGFKSEADSIFNRDVRTKICTKDRYAENSATPVP